MFIHQLTGAVCRIGQIKEENMQTDDCGGGSSTRRLTTVDATNKYMKRLQKRAKKIYFKIIDSTHRHTRRMRRGREHKKTETREMDGRSVGRGCVLYTPYIPLSELSLFLSCYTPRDFCTLQ